MAPSRRVSNHAFVVDAVHEVEHNNQFPANASEISGEGKNGCRKGKLSVEANCSAFCRAPAIG